MRLRALILALLAGCAADPTPSDVPTTADAVDVVAPDSPTAGDVVDAGGAQACTAGRIEECPCGDGRRGSQTCQPSGVYGACVCADAGMPMDVVVAVDVVDAAAAGPDVVVTADCGARYTFCPMGDAGLDQSCINLADGTRRGQTGLSGTNCGACGRSCEGGRICCGGRCFFPNEDLSDAGIPNCSRFP